jgi:hypothetical protein
MDDPEEFLEAYWQDVGRENLIDVVYDEFVTYCDENNIEVDQLSEDELLDAVELFVSRGFDREN